MFLSKMPHILFLLIITGCTVFEESELPDKIKKLENLVIIDSYEGVVDPIQFHHEYSYSNTERNPIGRISGLAIDSVGKVFIGDSDQATIHVFDPEGEYLQQLGKRGQGPGEFLSLDINIKVQDDLLYAYDPAQKRINIFSAKDLEFLHVINLSNSYFDQIEKLRGSHSASFFPLKNQILIMSFVKKHEVDEINEYTREIKQSRLFYKMDWNGKIQSDLLWENSDNRNYTYRKGGMMFSFSYPFWGIVSVATDGAQFYSGDSEDFLIKAYNVNGIYQGALYYPFTRRKLIRENAIQYYDDEILQNITSTISLPDTWPALNDLIIDDSNRIWISTFIEDYENHEWWIVEKNGELITKFKWSREEPIVTVKNGKMYTHQTDEETGLQQVVRYRIEMESVQ